MPSSNIHALANEYKKQLSSRIKSLEKQHEHASAEKAVKHKNEIEVNHNTHRVGITSFIII